jgi:regulatory protein spx
MLTIYTTPSCSSCRKAKKWLDSQDIEYKEINIFVKDLTEAELRDLLMRTENGADDIVSKRSKVIKEGNIDIDEMSVSELLSFLKNNPSAIRRPIITNEKLFQVGFNDDEITAFIPEEKREQFICQECKSCPERGDCDC